MKQTVFGGLYGKDGATEKFSKFHSSSFVILSKTFNYNLLFFPNKQVL